jgi:hypothetical protein
VPPAATISIAAEAAIQMEMFEEAAALSSSVPCGAVGIDAPAGAFRDPSALPDLRRLRANAFVSSMPDGKHWAIIRRNYIHHRRAAD